MFRADNLSAALMMVHVRRSLRRSELTARLGLTRSAVGSLVDELQQRGVVTVETSPTPGGTGRPSHLVSVAPDGPVALAVHLQAESYRVALVGLGGELVTSVVRPLPRPSPTPSRVLPAMARDIAATVSASPRPCAGVGVAVPSAVSRHEQHALAALYLHWPAAVPVRDLLDELLERAGVAVAVHVGNDANLAALAEHRHGAGVDATDMLFLTTGQRGVGGGLVLDGRLHTGSQGYALEVGHLTVDPAGRRCHCGNRGCLDVEADATAMVAAAGRRVRGDAEAAARRIIHAALTEPGAHAAVERIADRLGTGLAGLVNLFNPDRVVLGGLHAELLQLLPERLGELVRERSFLDAASRVQLCAGRLGADAVLLGAAELALQPLLDQPRAWPVAAG